MERSYRETFAENELLKAGIILGIPVSKEQSLSTLSDVGVPDLPHVFLCKELRLKSGGSFYPILDAVVMLGHGVDISGTSNGDGWVFRGSGKTVFETVKAYDQLSIASYVPPLDAVITCRDKLMPAENSNVLVTGVSLHAPHIFPKSEKVSILGYDGDVEKDRIFKNGVGVLRLTAVASDWLGILKWHRFWTYNFRETREISDKFKRQSEY